MTKPRDHLIRLAVFEVEDIINGLQIRARRPGCSTQKYKNAMLFCRHVEKEIHGKRGIENVDLHLPEVTIHRLAEVLPQEGLGHLSLKIVRQLHVEIECAEVGR